MSSGISSSRFWPSLHYEKNDAVSKSGTLFSEVGALVCYLLFASFNLIYGLFGPGLVGLFFFVSEFRKKQIIRVEDGEIFIGSSIGRGAAQLEPVTAVHCDQIEYHLYSKKYEISIWMKRFPADFRALFDEKYEEISV